MIQQIFSIQDTKSETFNPPFFQKNTGEALRTFSKLVNDPQSILAQFPEDFILVRLGLFDAENGEIIPEKPTNIGTASQYLKAGAFTPDPTYLNESRN